MGFTVAQEAFSGPLGLLLAQIERHDLEVTTVSLAAVAEEFLRYVESGSVPSEELADFLVVAARLIYIKSRELMPYLRLQEEDEGAAQLTEQLRVYREFAAAAERLEERYMRAPMAARPYARRAVVARFAPPAGVDAAQLAAAYRAVVKRLEPFFALSQASMERVESVEERIGELRRALAARASMRFRDVVRSGRKLDVVVSFLALLELLRQNVVKAQQQGLWGEIVIHRVE